MSLGELAIGSLVHSGAARHRTCDHGSKPMGSHFGIGAPLILVYFSGDWDVHWGYGVLTHGHVATNKHSHETTPHSSPGPPGECAACGPAGAVPDAQRQSTATWLAWQQGRQGHPFKQGSLHYAYYI